MDKKFNLDYYCKTVGLISSWGVGSFTSAGGVVAPSSAWRGGVVPAPPSPRIWSWARSVASPSTSTSVRTIAPPTVSVSGATSPGVPGACCWSTHVHTWSRGVGSLCDGKIYSDLLAIQICACHLISRLCSILYILVVYECKATWPTRVTVQHNLHFFHGTKSAKLFFQLFFSCVEAETKYSQTTTWCRVVSITSMSAARWHWGVSPPSSSPTSTWPGSGSGPPGTAARPGGPAGTGPRPWSLTCATAAMWPHNLALL